METHFNEAKMTTSVNFDTIITLYTATALQHTLHINTVHFILAQKPLKTYFTSTKEKQANVMLQIIFSIEVTNTSTIIFFCFKIITATYITERSQLLVRTRF